MLPFWHPKKMKLREQTLRGRALLMQHIREFFTDQEFIEVDTPALQHCPGMEVHLHAFSTHFTPIDPHQKPTSFYLHSSPEFAMKKILVGSCFPKIFQLSHVFRNGELTDRHLPEFMMLEWYRIGATYENFMDEVESLIHFCVSQAGSNPTVKDPSNPNAPECHLLAPFERLSVAQAFKTYAEIDLNKSLKAGKAPDRNIFAKQAQEIGIYISDENNWEDIFFKVMLEKIEPKLGFSSPTILYDYPFCMAVLSKLKSDDPRYAERFELYVQGLELANAFTELVDAQEQRKRFEEDQRAKHDIYGHTYPIDEDFLQALDVGMPESAGIALGFDRLLMVMYEKRDIRDVQFILPDIEKC